MYACVCVCVRLCVFVSVCVCVCVHPPEVINNYSGVMWHDMDPI